MLKAAHKLLHYKSDLLKPEELSALEAEVAGLSAAIKAKDREKVRVHIEQVDKAFSSYIPAQSSPALRENCEVFLVAIIITVGIRSFFLQPFTIPTGSMQPTLNGIRSYVTQEAPPNPLVRVLHLALYGRSYIDAVSQEDDTIVGMQPVKRLIFLDYTEIRCSKQRFVVHAPLRQLAEDFQVRPGRPLAKGEIIARGYVNTGDHVFVNKMAFHFTLPKRSDVFVFNTLGIGTNDQVENPGGPSQFYIKRLAGEPGDRLQIVPPKLFINGEVPQQFGFQRVMSEKDGYRGYSNSASNGMRFPLLGSPDATFVLPPKSYFALGDNSYNSSDSRSWGVVPEKNVTGKAVFVYWPFTSHWGLIQ